MDDHAPDPVITPPEPVLCEFCGELLPEPKHNRRQRQRFCSSKHRALWHKRNKEQHLATALEHLEELRPKK